MRIISLTFAVILCCAASPSERKVITDYPAINLTRGLISYWKMDDPSALASRDHSTGNNPLVNTSTSQPAGRYGLAMGFNGSSSYALGPTRQWPQSGFTIAMWLNIPNNTENGVLAAMYSSGNAYLQMFTQSGVIHVRIHQTQYGQYIGNTTSSPYPVSSWFHYAMTWNGGTTADGVSIYYNGVLQSVASDNAGTFTGPYTGALPITLGEQNYGSSNNNSYFQGSEDEVRIYNRALSSAEVAQLYRFVPDARQ